MAKRGKGRPRGVRFTRPLVVRIPLADLERVERVARAEGIKRSQLVRKAIARYCHDAELFANQLALPLDGDGGKEGKT